MRRGFSSSERTYRRNQENEQYSVGNIDLLNLRLNLPSERKDSPRAFERSLKDPYPSDRGHHPLQSSDIPYELKPNLNKNPQGYGARPKYRKSHRLSSEEIVLIYSNDSTKKIIQSDIKLDRFMYPSKKKVRPEESVQACEALNKNLLTDAGDSSSNFPFKVTPSGNLKVESSQVIFASKKLSVLVADPKNTQVNICREPLIVKPSLEIALHNQQEFAHSPRSPMETLMSQTGGFSSLGSLIGTSPIRKQTKEAAEYESRQTSEILDPELDLGRLGYGKSGSINWDKVKLPEKHNLYLELYHRIMKNTNADCRVYIDNEEFSCHLIVLQCYSELFDAYVAVKKVELPSDKCSVTAFSFIYDWMITAEPSYVQLSRENVLDIFISAKYLRIKDLTEQCWSFIDNVEVFNEDTAFLLYMDAKRRNLPEVKELMLPRIQLFFLMLVSSHDWLELEVDDVKNFLNSNYIAVNCEMEIFMAAVRWLKYDFENRDAHKYEVLDCVRFGNIAPWQLVDIKRNPENPDFMELTKDIRICKMIDDGLAYVIIKYWYGQETEDFQHWNMVLALEEPAARNWNGPDKTYFTFREFLIYLDQYRRNQLIEKNKLKLSEEIEKNTKEGGAGLPDLSSFRYIDYLLMFYSLLDKLPLALFRQRLATFDCFKIVFGDLESGFEEIWQPCVTRAQHRKTRNLEYGCGEIALKIVDIDCVQSQNGGFFISLCLGCSFYNIPLRVSCFCGFSCQNMVDFALVFKNSFIRYVVSLANL
ncbi:uncharacterized protein [Euwallacea similis]|uniref:uncharacterized protein n=1 Tax=Euwallacea similis TaxID=1736056 RepID=UPI00344FF8EE